MAAGTAENGATLEFGFRPNFRPMVSQRRVTFVAREPPTATLELQPDDVDLAMVMGATRFYIDLEPVHLDAMNRARHVRARSRGQINTSIAPTSQHPIIITKPVLSDPVR